MEGIVKRILGSLLLVLLATHAGAQAKAAKPQAKSSFIPTDPATSASHRRPLFMTGAPRGRLNGSPFRMLIRQ
jgi:hypothetical protein